MAEQLTKLIVDVATGEQKYIPLSKEEIDELEQSAIKAAEAQAAREAEAAAKEALRASAKAKLVAGEPLTEEEAGLLVS
jgi:uncharacterized coiled-coil DUF342 family protein